MLGLEIGGFTVGATSVNSRGQVAGWSQPSSRTALGTTAFLWQNGRKTDLGTLDGSPFGTYAFDINERGQIVGASSTAGGVSHAFLWENGRMRDLNTTPPGSAATLDRAAAINNVGQVAGRLLVGATSPVSHAFLWQNGQVIDLGTLGGDSEAFGLNDLGQVVGWSDTGVDDADGVRIYHAFLWENGALIDLDRVIPAGLGWVLIRAQAINNLGQIVGFGRIRGQIHAFLLTPQRK
jgi:probable HAF family extracellular repeat protein